MHGIYPERKHTMPHLHIEYTDNLSGLNERELREINAVVCAHPTVPDEG
ncbi:hypothetical protein J4711_14065 [Staphylococcus epidermidis]|nr:hypothetical protein [Staphylococcus epidermidis]